MSKRMQLLLTASVMLCILLSGFALAPNPAEGKSEVFSLNGMGTLIYDAVVSRDYPIMQGSFLVLTIFVLAANFAADMLYAVADPRIGGKR